VLVPSLWPFEIGNIFLNSIKRKRLTPEAARRQLERAMRFPIEIEPAPDQEVTAAIWRSAREFSLTFYDASYLELAARRGLPLATLDEALLVACNASGVPRLP
jgi:predicted nucleic acid-binding protein